MNTLKGGGANKNHDSISLTMQHAEGLKECLRLKTINRSLVQETIIYKILNQQISKMHVSQFLWQVN